jgi:hypothetical protein
MYSLKTLLQRYLIIQKEHLTSGKASRLRYRELIALREFTAWADRRGYEVIRRVDENGAAIFCAYCGGLISEASQGDKKGGE